MTDPDIWRLDYRPGTLRVGPGAVSGLGAELERRGLERALVVCGKTVGASDAVMGPVRAGLGDRLAGVFAETTPEKRLSTAARGLERVRDLEADVLVGLGGGSSLDTAKVMAVLAATDRKLGAIGDAFASTGTVDVPDGRLLPLVSIPTTLAGADLSGGAGVSADPNGGLVDEPTSGGVGDPRLMPELVVGDPELVATTPRSVLTGSAMNGFDKGIETLYARNATPVTDAAAMHGLSILHEALPALGDAPLTVETLEPVVTGNILVQYGVSRSDGSTLSIIHAFGHGLRRTSGLQQGVVHAIMAPHVLEYLFERVDARRDLLASAFGVDDREDIAAGVVERIRAVRDAMGLPAQLREVDGPSRERYEEVAELTLEDAFMKNAPVGLVPTRDDLVGVLRAAY